MKIALCDDEQHIHDIVGDMISDYTNGAGVFAELSHYHSADELLYADSEFDCILLDIDMPGMDGIELARKLKERGCDSKIVMLTGRVDRFKEAFIINAFRFVSKPVDDKELYNALDDVRKQLAGNNTIKVFRDGISYEIAEKDVSFFEADGSATLIFTNDSEYRSEKSLSEWMSILDNNLFFQCHKSFIVNLGKIERIDKVVAIMNNGDKVSVSRRRHKALLYTYMEYDTKRR